MTTEQYSIGYDAGYQDGFDAALTEPVKQDTPYCKSVPMCAKPCGDESCVEPVKQEPVVLHKVVLEHIADLRACVPTLRQYPEMESTCNEVVKAADELESALIAAPVQPVKQEPVAYQSKMSGVLRYGKHDDSDVPLYTAPVDAKAIRAEALEEAAKHLAESGLIGSNDCAAAIRGLKCR